jgi:hypothetical protein
MTKLEELIAERDRLHQEKIEAQARLDDAEQAVLEERFKDYERFQVGDVILVPRKLFGKTVWWPAKIAAVTLHYNEGWYGENYSPDPGGHWENMYASYTVFLKQKDDTFGGSSTGFYHNEVQASPEPADA